MTESRRKALRLPYHNYTQPSGYFITICTSGRECLFGEIVDGILLQNDLGHEVETGWNDLPGRYSGLALDQFVIMPNHIHGILVLAEGSSSISEIVRTFKELTSYRINQRRNAPGVSVWQRGFYDHIIRDDGDLSRIREYIDPNPARWALDEENPAGVSVALP